ncbi:MAG: ABC transporter transmembrane domain-containing protein, partial [Gammaproteobacteria bacterium]
MKQFETSGWAIYKRLLSYALPYWKLFFLIIISMIVFAATDTGFAALMKPMLDGNFVEKDPDTIRMVPLALIALFLFRGVTGFISRYGMSWIGRNIIKHLRQDMYASLLALPSQYLDHNSGGKLLSLFTYDVEQIAEATTNVMTIIIRDSLTLLFLLVFMLWVSVPLTLLFLIMGPVIALVISYASKRFRESSRRIQASMGSLTQRVEETLSGLRLIKSYSAQRQQKNHFQEVNEMNRAHHLKMSLINNISTPLVQFIAACTLALVIYLASSEHYISHISVGEFVSFMTAMMLLMQPMKRLTNINVPLQKGIAAAGSVFSLIDEIPEADTGKERIKRSKGSITFNHVSFKYGQGDRHALVDLSLDIQPGESIAIVGRSGSGKSTLVQLLERFYSPDSGEILLDGLSLDHYQLEDLRKQFAVVSQDIILFNDTVSNNLAIGLTATDRLIEKMIQATTSAHAIDFINQLPNKFETTVGDNGALLSGG